jgi:hypothetical protein
LKSQLSLEFLVFLMIVAVALGGALLLWREGVVGLEKAAAGKAQEDISRTIVFHSELLAKSRGSVSENFTIFPTVGMNVFSDGEKLTIASCGRFSGKLEPIVLEVRSNSFGAPAENCADFPLAGTIQITQKGGNAIEVADFN